MPKHKKALNNNNDRGVKNSFTPKISYFNNFIPKYVIKAILHNSKRSSTIIIAIIISAIIWVVSTIADKNEKERDLKTDLKTAQFDVDLLRNLGKLVGFPPVDRLPHSRQGYGTVHGPRIEKAESQSSRQFAGNAAFSRSGGSVYCYNHGKSELTEEISWSGTPDIV